MWIARVVGTVVSTRKHAAFEGHRMLLVQRLSPAGVPGGDPILALDTVDSGAGERVLVTIEGRAAREAVGDPSAPVDAVIVGIVDRVEWVAGVSGSRDR